MKLGMQIGLGPGHTVLGGNPAPLPKVTEPPIFGPYVVAMAKWLNESRCHLAWR